MKAFGIVIFSHIRSRISRPESGADMACIISMTSELTVNLHDDEAVSNTINTTEYWHVPTSTVSHWPAALYSVLSVFMNKTSTTTKYCWYNLSCTLLHLIFKECYSSERICMLMSHMPQYNRQCTGHFNQYMTWCDARQGRTNTSSL